MSSPLAIAAVTALLRDLLNEGLINRDLTTAGGFSVSSRPPDRVFGDGAETDRLNLFLYHTTPNLGWRNSGLPCRNDRGERIANPPLALDLHYLLTAYGAADFHAEILLGYAMHVLHETPMLPRQSIRNALAQPGATVSGTGLLPTPRFANLPAADLAEQIEQIKITPEYLSTEEMSKLWTAFQARFRPSAAYLVSVVLIQSTAPARTPLPVLHRGRFDPLLGRDVGVSVEPSMLPPVPTLVETELPKKQPAIRMGETFTVRGHHLAGGDLFARFTEPHTKRVLELEAEAGATATEFKVELPVDPAPPGTAVNSPKHAKNWQPGVYALAAIVRKAGEPDRVSNEVPVALAPALKLPIGVAKTGSKVTLTVKSSPNIRKTQQAALIVGSKEILGQPVLAAATNTQTDTIVFTSETLAAGTHPVRLRIDDVESILIDREAVPPAFLASQQVTIP